MLTKEEMQLRNAMKLLVRDGKSGQHYEAAKDRYINLKTDDRIFNIARDLDQNGVDFWLKQFAEDCEIIENLIK